MLGAICSILPYTAHAAEIKFDTMLFIDEGQTIEDNLIYSGDELVIKGKVQGDVIAFTTRRISIEGEVTGDVIVGTYELELQNAKIGSDIKALSWKGFLSGEVGGDVLMHINNVKSSLTIGGNLEIVTGTVGEIGGTIQGNTILSEESAIRFAPGTIVNGNLEYTGRQDQQFEHVDVRGETVRHEPDPGPVLMTRISDRFIQLLFSYFFGLILLLVLPNLFASFAKVYETNQPMHFIKGIAVLLVLILLIPTMFLIVFGIPLALLVIGLGFFAIYTSHILVSFWFGMKISKIPSDKPLKFLQKSTMLIVGLTVFYALTLIPIVNEFLLLWVAGSATGALFSMYMQYRKSAS
jgi:hypothetical protein